MVIKAMTRRQSQLGNPHHHHHQVQAHSTPPSETPSSGKTTARLYQQQPQNRFGVRLSQVESASSLAAMRSSRAAGKSSLVISQPSIDPAATVARGPSVTVIVVGGGQDDGGQYSLPSTRRDEAVDDAVPAAAQRIYVAGPNGAPRHPGVGVVDDDRRHQSQRRDQERSGRRPTAVFALDPVDKRLWDPCPCRDEMRTRLQKILNEAGEELYPMYIPEFMGPGGRYDGPESECMGNDSQPTSSLVCESGHEPVKRQRSVSLPKRLLLDFPSIHLHVKRKSSIGSSGSHNSTSDASSSSSSSDQQQQQHKHHQQCRLSLSSPTTAARSSSSPSRRHREGNGKHGGSNHSDSGNDGHHNASHHHHHHHGALYKALAVIDTNLRRLSLHSSLDHWRQRSRSNSTQSVESVGKSSGSTTNTPEVLPSTDSPLATYQSPWGHYPIDVRRHTINASVDSLDYVVTKDFASPSPTVSVRTSPLSSHLLGRRSHLYQRYHHQNNQNGGRHQHPSVTKVFSSSSSPETQPKKGGQTSITTITAGDGTCGREDGSGRDDKNGVKMKRAPQIVQLVVGEERTNRRRSQSLSEVLS